MRARNASQPRVWRSMNSRSSAPSPSTTWRSPRARAASVPGVGATPASCRNGAPQVMVGGEGVAAPEDDELREAQRLRIHADAVVSERVASAHPARDRADRHEMPGSAERVPEAAPRAVDALEQPHAARAQVRPDGFPTELAADPAQALRDQVERLVPRDALEVARPLRADAPHRVEETVRRLRVRDVVVELVAQDAARERMRGIALQLHRAPVLDGDDPAARVRTVHRARSEHLGFAVHARAPPISLPRCGPSLERCGRWHRPWGRSTRRGSPARLRRAASPKWRWS